MTEVLSVGALCEEVKSVFCDDEIGMVDDIRTMLTNCEELRDKQQETAKEIIRKLTAEVDEKESQLASDPGAEAHARRMALLADEADTALEQLERLSQQRKNILSERQELTAQFEELKSRRASITTTFEKEIPKDSWLLKLYMTACSVRWDFNSEDASGYILPPNSEGAAPKNFHFSRTEKRTVVAHKMWDMIEECL